MHYSILNYNNEIISNIHVKWSEITPTDDRKETIKSYPYGRSVKFLCATSPKLKIY
jgi:hypothetical protein